MRLLLLLLLGCNQGALPASTDMGTLCPFAPVMVCNCCCDEPNPPVVCVQRGQSLESLLGKAPSQCGECTQPVIYECCD